jgi:hypothetical protein
VKKKSSLSRLVKDAFRVEPLEPRVLLSADPLTAAMPVIVMNDRDREQAVPGFHDFSATDEGETASLVGPAPSLLPLSAGVRPLFLEADALTGQRAVLEAANEPSVGGQSQELLVGAGSDQQAVLGSAALQSLDLGWAKDDSTKGAPGWTALPDSEPVSAHADRTLFALEPQELIQPGAAERYDLAKLELAGLNRGDFTLGEG